MDYGIKGKIALVGGASKGLGRAAAAALAREGARVAICARNEKEVAAAAAALAAESGGEVIGLAADLGTAEGSAKVLEEAKSILGEIDILVTNTGGPKPGGFFALQEKDWDQAYDLLLKSALRLARGVVPGMQARKWGRIVGITSVSVKEPIESLLLSNVFRVGVTALYKSLAREVAKDGITVNTVLPGLTNTERLTQLYGFQAAAKGVAVEDFLKSVAADLPLKRLNEPHELGELVAFLASTSGSGITGCAIQVDGGQLKGLM